MIKTLVLTASLLAAGLSLAPANAAPVPVIGVADHGLIDTVQYGYRDGGRRFEGRGYGPRPGRVVGRLLGVGPRDGYRGRGPGYGRGYGRGDGYGLRRRDRY